MVKETDHNIQWGHDLWLVGKMLKMPYNVHILYYLDFFSSSQSLYGSNYVKQCIYSKVGKPGETKSGPEEENGKEWDKI